MLRGTHAFGVIWLNARSDRPGLPVVVRDGQLLFRRLASAVGTAGPYR